MLPSFQKLSEETAMIRPRLCLSALTLCLAAPVAMAQRTADPVDHRQHAAQSTQTQVDVVTPAHLQEDRPDTWVLTKVKAKFTTSTLVDGGAINVDVSAGVVKLIGQVPSTAQRQEAMRLAASTDGVKRVDASGLTVSAEAASDYELEEDPDRNKR